MTLRSRLPFIVMLAAVLGGLIVAGTPDVSPIVKAQATRNADHPAVLASADARSAAWYCPLAAASRTASATDSIAISNTRSRKVAVELSGLSERKFNGRRRLDIGGNSTTTIQVTDLGAARNVGAVVEAFGPGIVVEHLVNVAGREAATPCASNASGEWYFPAVTTRKHMRALLALLNPFGQGALVDITLMTPDGPLRPRGLQAVDIGARSQRLIELNSGADQVDVFAVLVKTRNARVVGELLQVGRDTMRTSDASLMLGVPSLQQSWHLVDADVRSGRTHRLVVANPSDAALDVTVQILASGTNEVDLSTVRVPAGSASTVDVPADSDASSVSVIASARRGFTLGTIDVNTSKRSPGASVATSMHTSANRWVFAVSRTSGLDAATLALENDSDQDIEVTIHGAAAGISTTVTVRASQRTTVQLTRNTVSSALSIDADGPVFVARRLTGDTGLSRANGIPAVD